MTDWSKSHNGVMLCDFNRTIELMPEVEPHLVDLVPHLELPLHTYLFDVKVHMLMPEEYPCIPNWHRDFVPRKCDMSTDSSAITGEKMYLWTSGGPLPEWKKEMPKVGEFGWTVFDQNDFHRGTKSKEHIWRCFIRAIPKRFVHNHATNVGEIRRHSQVYIENPDKFRW